MDRKRFLDLVEKNVKLMESKHGDYNEGGVTLESYFPFGNKSYAQMLHVKTMRMVSLLQSGREPNYESVEDTVRDLINYSVYYLDFLDRRDGA